jgi:hypothetical protein
VGVRDAAGETIALGAIVSVDERAVTIATPARREDVAAVTIGETTRAG